MNKWYILLFTGLCASVHAAITVNVNPTHGTTHATVQLTIQQEPAKKEAMLDLSALEPNFTILSTSHQTSYTFFNGQAQSVGTWIISLSPNKAGALTIPAIQVGPEHTQPVTLQVEDNPNAPPAQKDVLLRAEVNTKTPYVNQQIVYTVKLMHPQRLLDASYQPPTVEDALLFPLGDSKRYQTQELGKTYLVEEQQYAIYPQKSGTLTINSPSFTALVFDTNPQRITAKEKPMTLHIAPIPAQYTGNTWLPAKQITLHERYENTHQSLDQGSTLVRTITLQGAGIPAQLLPELAFPATQQYTVYPEKAKEENRSVYGELIGTRKYKVTYLFKQPGKITLPALQLLWFNTQTAKEERTELPPRTLEIKSTDVVPPQKDPTPVALGAPVQKNGWPWGLALVFALAWVLTLGLWWVKPARSGKPQIKKALRQLQQACVNNRAETARDALLFWAALHWPDARVRTLHDVLELTSNEALKTQIQHLSHKLYSNRVQTGWLGMDLFAAVQAVVQGKVSRSRQVTRDALPAVNPT